MPFALIPDGFTLKKVTKAQEQAIKDKRRHDDVVALLNNPAASTAILAPIIAIATGAVGSAIVAYILNLLKDEGVDVTEELKDRIQKGVDNVTSTTSVIKEAITTGRIGESVGAPLGVDVVDIPEIILEQTFKRLGLKFKPLEF